MGKPKCSHKNCDRPVRERKPGKYGKHCDRHHNLKVMYGLSPDDWDELYYKQNGRCAICNRHQNELKLVLYVDHDHKTGKVRGLLCAKCNMVLGGANDDPKILKKAIKYLNV